MRVCALYFDVEGVEVCRCALVCKSDWGGAAGGEMISVGSGKI